MVQKLNAYSNIYINSAKKIGFKTKILALPALVEFKKKGKKFRLYYCILPCNNSVASRISQNKNITSNLLLKANLPALKQLVINHLTNLNKQKIKFPVAVKPLYGIGGKGVTGLVNNHPDLKKAFLLAFKIYPKVVIEEHQSGADYRLLVVENKVIAACRRLPPQIKGNGINNIKELIMQENKRRNSINHKNKINIIEKILIDKTVERKLNKLKLNLTSVLKKNKILILRENANFSTGGTVEALKNSEFHPGFIKAAIKATKEIGLKISGVDIIARDISQPCQRPNAAMIEINHYPGIRIHHYPSKGKSTNAAGFILKYIYQHL